jgi:hypothetical protein
MRSAAVLIAASVCLFPVSGCGRKKDAEQAAAKPAVGADAGQNPVAAAVEQTLPRPKPVARFRRIDIGSLRGMTRAQLQPVFPGSQNELTNGQGWRVELNFNNKQRLAYLTFTPPSAMQESAAAEMVARQFGVFLPKGAYTRNRGIHAYRRLEGPVRLVHFIPEDPKDPQSPIKSIELYYDIGWNE